MTGAKVDEKDSSSLELGEKLSGSSDSYAKKTTSGTVLVPQPSDDPQDPLVCGTSSNSIPRY